MIFYAVAFGLLLHALFWGAGLAMLAMPRAWERFWPVLMLPAGFALQSVVVWLGAYAGLPGTNSYAGWAELIPVALLVTALWRRGWRRAAAELMNFGLVWAIVVGVLMALVLPLALTGQGLTSVSLGSCDAADYAAGARVMMEFARSDRSGFLGLTEVVRVMSADNFYDFWLRLNHFTPSALMALNGSILDCRPHELASVLTAVILAATVPAVFWMARALFGYSAVASLIIAAVYGISPITWYSFAQVSPAPLLAANAIALLNWSGFALWRSRLSGRRGAGFAGVLAIAYTLVLGAYNFILIVCLIPALAYAAGQTLAAGDWRRLARWLAMMIAPFVVAALVFFDRVTGLAERFMLFQTYDFGWRIPALWPEGWLGMVQGGSLEPWPWFGLRWVLAAVIAIPLGWAIVRAVRQGRQRIWVVGTVLIPILAGYAFLEIRGIVRGTNASYDAFKLFAVFYPLLLPAFCWWITLRWSLRLTEWLEVALLAAVVVAFNLVGCGMSVWKLSRAPLRVDGELRQLRRVEDMPDVRSVNLLIPDMWSRLWANEFLLRKPQYFETHTYEGRLNTPLRGEWDLNAGPVRVQLGPLASRPLTTHYWLTDTRSPTFLRVQPGDGWYVEERLPNGERWSWTRGDATLRVTNPQDRPVRLRAVLDGRGYVARQVALTTAGAPEPGYIEVGQERRQYALPDVVVPPGKSVLALRLKEPPVVPPGETRPLGLCVFSLVLEPVD